VVEDGQRQRLQHHGLGERRLHHQDGRAGEIAVALGVTPDVALELERLQVPQGGLVGDPGIAEKVQFGPAEPELLQGVEEPPGARDHPIAAAVRQIAGKHLENRPPGRRAAAQGPRNHGQFVVVGQQGGARVRVIAHEWKTTE
jgi:hypothetical protein